jgi:MYXO-CTERM domain-containing protein
MYNKMKKLLKKSLAISLLMIGAVSTSQAGIIVHDSVGEFSELTYTAGPVFSGSTIASNRQLLANLFDNDTDTMLSLGNAGTLVAVIDPTSNSISSGSVIELTNGNTHDESAIVALGVNGTDWIDIGELFGNANSGGTNAVTFMGQTVATVTAGSASSASVFTINVLSGGFNSIRITDNTASLLGSSSQDGFDIASFSVTSVSSPATLGLLGLSIAALGFAGRRRKQA